MTIYYGHLSLILFKDIQPYKIMVQPSFNIADFGSLHKTIPLVNIESYEATPHFLAPEIFEGRHSEKSDIWSCGVLLYTILAGRPPFQGRSNQEIIDSIKRGIFNFAGKEWRGISFEAKELIRHMLLLNPGTRPCTKDVLLHSWFRLKDQAHLNRELVDYVKPNLIKFWVFYM